MLDELNLENVAKNVQAAEIDGKLILVIDLAATVGLSNSGKMMGIASSGGFTKIYVGEGRELSLNMFLGDRNLA